MRSVVRVGASLGVAAMLLLRPGAVAAQPQERGGDGVQFLAERGASVEILGLEHWTPAMLRDSLGVYAPDASLVVRLAETLREALGFPNAIAQRQSGDSAVNMLVAVIEPQAAARIERRTFTGDTAQVLAPWTALVESARTQSGLLAAALDPLIYARTVGLEPAIPLAVRPDSNALRQVWAALEAHRGAEDLDTARRLLTTSANVYDRVSAVAVLSSFEHEDAAWNALVGAMLDPDPRVRNLAVRALGTFTSQAARPVDWRPAAETLHAILDGARLSLLPRILDMLVATGVAPELAGPLLAGGGHAVLMYAGATDPAVRLPSYRFLRGVSGRNDATPAEWRAWIAELER